MKLCLLRAIVDHERMVSVAAPPFFLSLCCFKGLRTATAQIVFDYTISIDLSCNVLESLYSLLYILRVVRHGARMVSRCKTTVLDCYADDSESGVCVERKWVGQY